MISLWYSSFSPRCDFDSLPSYDVVVWTYGLAHFPFKKEDTGVLADCSLYGAKEAFLYSVGPACSIFSAKACAILKALRCSRQHQQVRHCSFLPLFSDSCFVLATLSLFFPSFYLTLTNFSGRNHSFSSSPLLSGFNNGLLGSYLS